MALSDLVGAFAGLLLIVAPLRDQRARWKVMRNTERAEERQTALTLLRRLVAEAWEAERNRYSRTDAWTQLLGAVFLLLAFGLKLFDR